MIKKGFKLRSKLSGYYYVVHKYKLPFYKTRVLSILNIVNNRTPLYKYTTRTCVYIILILLYIITTCN